MRLQRYEEACEKANFWALFCLKVVFSGEKCYFAMLRRLGRFLSSLRRLLSKLVRILLKLLALRGDVARHAENIKNAKISDFKWGG